MRVQKVQKVQRVQRGRLTGLRPEGCGRLPAAGCVRFAQGAGRKVLRIDRPAAGGFLSLTGPLAPRVVVSPSRAMSMKSALRDCRYGSYSLIRILLTGSLRSPPPIRLRQTSPAVRSVNRKEGPFMGRLRAYFDRLAHPMQDVHRGRIKLTHSEE